MVIARGSKVGTLYMTTDEERTIAAAVSQNCSELWHRRLGHMSEKGMKVLAKDSKLPGLKSVNLDMCEGCIFGKQKKVSFRKGGKAPKEEKLALVHSDVWGPSPVTSLGGAQYYVTFIDDSTRKTWVYFLKHKSEVFKKFQEWKAMVELETGNKLKCLRSDNGGEYIDAKFVEFCAQRGIRMEKTIRRTPQQNGVAERMNRTINERARSMRLQSGLPKALWAHAVSTAVYLINRGPSVPLERRIPEEEWVGKPISYEHLRVFGCLSYIHVDINERTKLDSKSKVCYFVGYGGAEFGYRFWDGQTKKIIRSKDVIFNESILYKDR